MEARMAPIFSLSFWLALAFLLPILPTPVHALSTAQNYMAQDEPKDRDIAISTAQNYVAQDEPKDRDIATICLSVILPALAATIAAWCLFRRCASSVHKCLCCKQKRGRGGEDTIAEKTSENSWGGTVDTNTDDDNDGRCGSSVQKCLCCKRKRGRGGEDTIAEKTSENSLGGTVDTNADDDNDAGVGNATDVEAQRQSDRAREEAQAVENHPSIEVSPRWYRPTSNNSTGHKPNSCIVFDTNVNRDRVDVHCCTSATCDQCSPDKDATTIASVQGARTPRGHLPPRWWERTEE